MRPSHRRPDEMRPVRITRGFTRHAEGSVLIEFGDTRVLCTASVEESVPGFRGKGQGWLTAEYGMLPRSTHTRSAREAARGKQSGRTQEIQRLIGRSIRAVVDPELGERQIVIDCDVLQADGGTRTASITGACDRGCRCASTAWSRGSAGRQPDERLRRRGVCGHVPGVPVLDLDYPEDSDCETDMNVVMTGSGGFVEVQGTAEGKPFHRDELDRLLVLASNGIAHLVRLQREALQG